MCLILTVCCLTPPPFRRPSCLLFIFFLFFQDGLALITFTIEQPGSPHSRPGFPPSLCYICQAHGLSFAWTFSSSSMWPRTSTNRAGNRPQSSSSCTRWGGQCGPWPRHPPGAPRFSWAGLSEVFSFSWEHLDSGSNGPGGEQTSVTAFHSTRFHQCLCRPAKNSRSTSGGWGT